VSTRHPTPDDARRARLPGGRPGPAGPATLLAVAASLALCALAAVVAVVVGRHGAPLPVDLAGHREALRLRTPGRTAVAVVVTTTGSGVVAYLLAAAAGAVIAGRPRWPAGSLAAVAALAGGQLIRLGLATSVRRARPPAADWAWHAGGPALPSGHATTSALVAALLCVALGRRTHGPARAAGVALVVGWSAAVGGTRVYLGMHWPTDVLAGWLLATGLTLTVAALSRRLRRRASPA
jgi:PAP2 superfamily protein